MKNNLLFFISFSIAKGIVFLSPILLADILSEKDFGIIEYALAGVGMLLNSLINLGVAGAYPYFILKQKNKTIKNGFKVHPIWLAVFLVLNHILYFFFNVYDIEYYLAFTISYIVANQFFYSTQLKSHSKIHQAVFLDAGVYIILLFFILNSFFDFITVTISNINIAIQLYAGILFMYSFYVVIQSKKEHIIQHYKQILKFSIHLLVASFFLFALTVSGRILTKHFFGYEATAVYGFYYRLSAVVVMIYQVVSIRYFKDLYTKNPKTLDSYFSLFYIFIFVLSIVIYFLTPYFVPYFSDFFTNTFTDNKLLFFIIFCQMTMWIATALHSNIVDREGLAKRNNLYFLILFIVSILFIYLTKEYLSLLTLTLTIYTIFFVTCLVQIITLKIENIKFHMSAITLSFVYISSCFILYLMH